MPKNEINFYLDTLIVETILRNNQILVKQADSSGLVSGLIDKVKEYVGNHIDPKDKVGSLLNILGPGAIAMTFSAMGLGWLGTLMGLSMRIFNIDVKSIISSIWDKLKPIIANDKPISSAQIDSFVQNAVEEHAKPATKEEAEKAVEMMEKKSFDQLMRDARFVKISMIKYQQFPLEKNADFFSMFSNRKSKTSSILARILGWIFKVALASAGLMVAGDVVNKFLGRPNAFDSTIQSGKPIEIIQPTPIPANVAKQTKYPIKTGYVLEKNNIGDSNWIERIANNQSSIEEMLIDFTKSVYDGLDGKEEFIKNSSAFQVVRDRIVWYNRASAGAPFIFLPKYFTSKKQIVDYFIDDVAERSS